MMASVKCSDVFRLALCSNKRDVAIFSSMVLYIYVVACRESWISSSEHT